MEIWKQRKGSDATYRNLMGVFSTAGNQACADLVQQICMNTGEYVCMEIRILMLVCNFGELVLSWVQVVKQEYKFHFLCR